jgi:hypothetical protein
VKRKFHAPFWSSGRRSDPPIDCNGTYMDPPALSRRLQVQKHASGQMQPYIRPRSEDIL